MSELQIRVVEALEGITAQAWNTLHDHRDPFVSHEFLAGLERHDCLTAHGWYPSHLLAFIDGALVGALPLYVRDNSYGEFVFDWAWAEAYERAGGRYYPKLVSAVPFTPVSGPRLLLAAGHPARQQIAKTLIAAAMELARTSNASSWHCLFPADAQLDLLTDDELLVRQGCQYQWFNHGYQSFDDFLGSLNSKRRKEIRRERRLVAASGLVLEELRGEEITPRHWSIFYEFYCSTFERKWGAPRLTESFLQSLSLTLSGVPVLFLARDGEHYVAGAFALHGADTLYGRHWGCSEHYRNLHFELCYYRTIDYCIRMGLNRLDAGAQGEHKIPRGFEPVKTWSLHWIRDPGFRRAVKDFLRRETTMIDGYIEDLEGHTAYRRSAQDGPSPREDE